MVLIDLEDVEIIADYLSADSKILEGKKLLVTGGAGFLGSFFLDVFNCLNKKYLKEPCNILCVDNLIVSDKGGISHLLKEKNFEFLQHDITKPLKTGGKIDFIVHAASIASPTFYRKYPIQTMDVNATGTRNMLEFARKNDVESFLFTSTSEVYGDPSPENIPTPESYWGHVSCTGPRACYDESKRFGETQCLAFFKEYGIPVKITRTFNAYGPRLSLKDKRVIPDFISNCLKNEPIRIFSDGGATRSFCYVRDNIRANLKVFFSGFNGEIFNVGDSREEISILDLAEILNRICKNDKGIVYKKNKDKDYLTDNPNRRCPDTAKIERMLGWKAEVGIEEGLKRTVQWHKQKGG